jgi:hypothetical protein
MPSLGRSAPFRVFMWSVCVGLISSLLGVQCIHLECPSLLRIIILSLLRLLSIYTLEKQASTSTSSSSSNYNNKERIPIKDLQLHFQSALGRFIHLYLSFILEARTHASKQKTTILDTYNVIFHPLQI